MSGILRLESLTKGNTLKQGDKTPLKYRLFDADGEKLSIAGKSAQVRLVYPDFLTIGYEKGGLTVAQDDTVTFTIDKVILAKLYHVEIIVDDQFIFPSRADESKFTVDKSSLGTEANIIEIVGVDAVVRKAVDLINVDPSLIIDEDKLVTDIISNSGIGSIEEYYQQFNDVITELSEEKDYHSLPEIAGARGGYDTLGERLADKVGGGVLAEMGDLSQGVKTAMTGGSVAVVGEGAVTADNLANDTKSLMGIKRINLFQGDFLNGHIEASDGTLRNYDDSRRATDFIPIDEYRTLYTNRLTFAKPQFDFFVVAFYDSDKNFIGTVESSDNSVVPLSNSAFIRMTVITDTGAQTFNPDDFLIWQEHKSQLLEDTKELKEAIELEEVGINLFDGYPTNAVVRDDIGELTYVGADDAFSTEFIEIDPSKPIYSNRMEISGLASHSFVYYDVNKIFIGSGVVTTAFHTPPSNAKFVRETISAPRYPAEVSRYKIWQDVRPVSKTIESLTEKVERLERQTEIELPAHNRVFVSDFDDGVLSDSNVISKSIDFMKFMKERTIIIDQRDWYIDEAILLPSNTTVIVDGVTIKQNDNVFDNVFRGDNFEINPDDPNGYPLSISEISNIKIIGINGAKIEGPDVNYKIEHPTLGLEDAVGDYYGWRTFQICLSKASNFEIYGFGFTKSRCWALSFDKCSHFKVHDLEVISNVKNGDGVDIRSGCHDFEVYNISGSTSDDSVAMSAIDYSVSGNYVYPLEPSKFEDENYTPEELSIYNGYVGNITTTGKHHGVICLSSGGRKVFNITINHVVEPSASMRESVVKIYSSYGSGYTTNDLNNIRVNNILSKGATHAVQVTHKVDNVWFNKIRQENPVGNVSSITDMDGVKITNA